MPDSGAVVMKAAVISGHRLRMVRNMRLVLISSSWLALLGALALYAPEACAADAKGQVPVVNEVLGPHGFIPNHLTLPSGEVLFLVRNRSRFPKMQLALVDPAGKHARDLEIPKERDGWTEFVPLEPGEHVLQDANDPGHILHLTITDSGSK